MKCEVFMCLFMGEIRAEVVSAHPIEVFLAGEPHTQTWLTDPPLKLTFSNAPHAPLSRIPLTALNGFFE